MEYTPREKTDFIVIHCAATRPDQDIGEDEIRRWHKDNGWADIGYNLVIRRSGQVEIGRPLDYRGAHDKGYNGRAVGLCLVGGVDDNGHPDRNFTEVQFDALKIWLQALHAVWPEAQIVGHRDLLTPDDPPKACPSFDVRSWLEDNGL
jgi:N-acetylmuramoyl-L-alanine amidase